ncbi:hypothetical protein Pla123a_44470 [Posidoniimonas polymericola]|uniref:Squalene--hopene cyclase n=1 Tax=Posidoniimonas polymericola TaxID=2528002 RepID=A0A5C5XWI7_9BACT|nr:prenyltransferase/squalene oxidase repeat-containing protein [Posidoniimonas polymericola]TWT67018.1 hypothetical protein Pla123a_44470 [Posidoniimonas polymericola]
MASVPRQTDDAAEGDEVLSEGLDAGHGSLVDLSGWLRFSPPWLLSALLHLFVVLVLGLWLVSGKSDKPLVLDVQYAEDVGDQLLEDPLDLEMDNLLEEVDEQTLSVTPLPPVDDPIAAPELSLVAPNPTFSTFSSNADQVGVALTGREPGMKAVLLKAYGGTESTERAVLDGLKWLERNQKKNGSWSLKGPYTDGGTTENVEAATAMALLAFQGAGYTHKDSAGTEFYGVVRDGWERLLQSQDDSGNFFRGSGFNHALYTQAQCTIALCELYAMTRDEELQGSAQKAVDYCVKTQSESGGWRYIPREGADTSVTGWFVMALKSAQMAGLDVPSETFYKAGLYLDAVARNQGSHYAYQKRDSPSLSMTAEGLLCRQYLGWRHDDDRLRRGVYYLLENRPSWSTGKRDVYYWYYATQVLHHMEGEEWTKWNNVTRQLIPEHQVRSGREKGSWDTNIDQRHGRTGGRLYTTCLSLYILEVYYRHLPIYQQGLLSGF